jgi:hypothetical protein
LGLALYLSRLRSSDVLGGSTSQASYLNIYIFHRRAFSFYVQTDHLHPADATAVRNLTSDLATVSFIALAFDIPHVAAQVLERRALWKLGAQGGSKRRFVERPVGIQQSLRRDKSTSIVSAPAQEHHG